MCCVNTRKQIVISGTNGKMGRALIEAIQHHHEIHLVGAIGHVANPIIGQDAGSSIGITTQVIVTDSLEWVLQQTKADVLIDFTRPQATLSYIPLCVQYKTAMVIGTTGFSQQEKNIIQTSSQSIPIVLSPNFSIGVNTMFALLNLATSTLKSGYDIEIIEAHHRHKADAPSGTALRMGEIIAENKQVHLEDVAIYSRENNTETRKTDSIGFSSIRGGDIIGDHTVLFATDGERVEITHKASSRLAFAHGAIHAANWVQQKSNGLYNMQNVLSM